MSAQKSSPCKRHFLLAALPVLAAAALAGAQSPAPGPPSFDDTAEVLAVEVPVNVVGRDGQPVRGLTAADFEVFDEGKEQAVTGFEVVDLESLQAGSTAEARHIERARIEQLDSTARRHFLFLFDLSFASPTAIIKARLAARDFLLSSLHPTDLAAVATLSLEQGFRLVVTFTPDRAQLARAIDTLGTQRVFTAGDTDPLRFVISPPSRSSASSSGAEQGSLPNLRGDADAALLEHLIAISKHAARDQKAFEISRVSAMTRTMGEMARSLNAIQGRKHVVYFSEGFNSRLLIGRGISGAEGAEDAENALYGNVNSIDTDNEYGSTKLQGDVRRMLEEFRRADCVIQAVDVGGLRTDADASESTRTSGKEALFYLANETGGELFKDTNDLGVQLDRMLRRSSVTYLLTFERSDLKHDGSYRRLRVKAKLPAGARLSHRAGYYAPRPFKDLDPLEKNLLASDGIASAAPRRDLDVHVLAAPFRASDDLAYVPVIVEIGGRSLLAGGPPGKGDKLNVELYAYVSDERGEMRDFFTRVVSLDLGKGRDAVLATGVKYYGHLDLEPGRYRVRVLVRNAATGRTGVESLQLTVPSYRAGEADLLPPLFFESPGRWLMVRERDDSQQASVVYPFTVNGEPYVPSARPRLNRRDEARLCLVAYNLGQGNLDIGGQVLTADGRELDGGHLSLVERTATGLAGVDKLIATFRPTGLEAGSYLLKVEIANAKTGIRDVNYTPFQVVN